MTKSLSKSLSKAIMIRSRLENRFHEMSSAYSSTDNFLSPIQASDWLIFFYRNLILHQKKNYENNNNTIFFDEKQKKKCQKSICCYAYFGIIAPI